MNVEVILKKYFDDYQEFHIWAIVITLFLTVVIQIIQAVYVSNRIEKYKNELKKSEIKFSRFNELQIESLKSIYDKIVDFHYMNFRLFFPVKYEHNNFKNRIDDWKKGFNELMDIFHREKILLPSNLKIKIKDFEQKFNIIYINLNLEIDRLRDIENLNESYDVQEIYLNYSAEVENIKSRLNFLNNINEISQSETTIKELRLMIEDYFENLTK